MADAKTSFEEIRDSVNNNKISFAAFLLRNHIEHVAPELVEFLGGSVPFRMDGAYNGGQMLGSAVNRLGDLLGIAGQPDRVLKNSEKVKQVIGMIDEFKKSKAQQNVEQWAINSAVHYNPWENFVAQDFMPVVDAFEKLLSCFRCDECESSLYLLPRNCFKGKEESLRCDCGTVNFNLKKPNATMRHKRKSKTSEAAAN